MAVVLAGKQHPLEFQLVDVVPFDFSQRAVAPSIVRAANRKPVAILGLFQPVGGDGL